MSENRPILDFPDSAGWWWLSVGGVFYVVDSYWVNGTLKVYFDRRWFVDDLFQAHYPTARFTKLLEQNPFTTPVQEATS